MGFESADGPDRVNLEHSSITLPARAGAAALVCERLIISGSLFNLIPPNTLSVLNFSALEAHLSFTNITGVKGL